MDLLTKVSAKGFIKTARPQKMIGKTTRLLAKLKAHGMIKKVPRKN